MIYLLYIDFKGTLNAPNPSTWRNKPHTAADLWSTHNPFPFLIFSTAQLLWMLLLFLVAVNLWTAPWPYLFLRLFILFKANVCICYSIFDWVNRSDLTSSQQWCWEHLEESLPIIKSWILHHWQSKQLGINMRWVGPTDSDSLQGWKKQMKKQHKLQVRTLYMVSEKYGQTILKQFISESTYFHLNKTVYTIFQVTSENLADAF